MFLSSKQLAGTFFSKEEALVGNADVERRLVVVARLQLAVVVFGLDTYLRYREMAWLPKYLALPV